MKNNRRQLEKALVFVLVSLFFQSYGIVHADPKNMLTRRYLRVFFDMYDRGTINADLYPLVDRAANVGYNGLMLREWYHDLDVNSGRRKGIEPLKQLKAYAEAKGMTVVPWGLYQGEVADEDSSQAEAFPVKGTQFRVTGSTAATLADHVVQITNGGFESLTGNKPAGWNISGVAAGVELFVDAAIKKSGSVSLRIENPKGTSCIKQQITGLKPFRAYELSAWIKTQAYSPAKRLGFKVVGTGGRQLLSRRDVGFSHWGARGNLGSFRKYTIDFNSLECSQASVSFNFSKGPANGKVWLDEIAVREVGLYETIRRPSCPVIVRSEDGSTVYAEGRDYTVSTGPVLCDNCSDGQALLIPSGSRIQDGQLLRVDWFQHANVETKRASTSFCSNQAWDLTSGNIAAIDELFSKAPALFLYYDEWRDAGWDPACARFPNAGEYMGWVASETHKLLTQAIPGREIYMPNDMYDPYHNAHDLYSMTRAGTARSWQGLPPSTVIINWRPGGKIIEGEDIMLKSLKFFAGMDPKYPKTHNRQILSVFFGQHAATWEKHLVEAEKQGLTGVIGMAYVSWSKNYSGIEEAAEIWKKAGRWGKGPIPPNTGIKRNGAESRLSQNVSLHVESNPGRIEFVLARDGMICLEVSDARGRIVRKFVDGRRNAGKHSINLRAQGLPAGVYFVTLAAGERGALRRQARKLVLF